MAIAALILGIVSLIFCWIPLYWWIGIFAGVGGIIFGALGKKSPTKQGMATAGLVMSIVGVALALICWIACYACAACYSVSSIYY